MPAIVSVAMPSGAVGGRMPQREVADVQVLPFQRRTGLRHLCVQCHPDRRRLAPHRERRAQIADQRCDHVAGPRAVGQLPLRAAAQPDRGRVDGLLAERSKTLALKRRALVSDLAADEEAP